MSKRKIIHEPKIVVDSRAHTKTVVAKSLDEEEKKAVKQEQETPAVTNEMPAFDAQKSTILYVITKASWGGAQKYVYDLALHFSKDYNIAVAFGKNEFTGRNIFREKLEEIGVRVYPIEAFGKKMVLSNEIVATYHLRKIVKEVKPDIMHLNSPKAGGLGGLVGRLSGVSKIIYTVHGLNTYEDRPGYEIAIVNMITKWILGLAHELIVISQLELDKLTSWGFSKKLNLVYNGLHPVNYMNADEKLRHIVKDAPAAIAGKLRSHETVIIGSLAEMTANKGIFYTLEALLELKKRGIEFVYIHYGTGDQEKLLSMEVEQFGLGDSVLFKGFDKQAAAYLPVFDIFVLPSIKEGLPYTLLEAAGAANAVVATNVGGIPEIIEHEKTGILVESKEVEQLADAIEKLARDRELRKQYGQALKDHVEQAFSLDRMYQETQEVYNS